MFVLIVLLTAPVRAPEINISAFLIFVPGLLRLFWSQQICPRPRPVRVFVYLYLSLSILALTGHPESVCLRCVRSCPRLRVRYLFVPIVSRFPLYSMVVVQKRVV